MNDEKIRELELPMMVKNNSSRFKTAYTISIEAAEGVTTGVSAADRVRTVKMP
jgi:3,4-dihydroxy 2-butanone 4-phosphate synthase